MMTLLVHIALKRGAMNPNNLVLCIGLGLFLDLLILSAVDSLLRYV
jgi:hypothetical protein